tara:strand:+ start:2232 stop:2963 length:732 start_codon:yes stop_codon:yes gene_type:complete
MHPQKISTAGLNLVKQFEGLHKLGEDGLIYPYLCPANKLTQGYGATKGIKKGITWTKSECEQRLIADLSDHAEAIYKHVKVPLSQNQFDALVSFVYNLGASNFKSSTLLKKLNAQDYDAVPEQLMRWNKARVNGKLQPLKGLTRRRTAEAALFSMDSKLPDEENGEIMTQKPQADAIKPLRKSKTMVGAGVGGVAVGLSEVSSQLEGFISYSETLKTLFLVLAIAGIGLAAYARFKDHKEGVH